MAVERNYRNQIGHDADLAEDGNLVGCTVLQAGPCVVVQTRTKQKDGYEAAQLGLVEFVKPQRVNKAMTGHFKKANVAPDESDAGSAHRRIERRNESRRPRAGGEFQAAANLWMSAASAKAKVLPAA